MIDYVNFIIILVKKYHSFLYVEANIKNSFLIKAIFFYFFYNNGLSGTKKLKEKNNFANYNKVLYVNGTKKF